MVKSTFQVKLEKYTKPWKVLSFIYILSFSEFVWSAKEHYIEEVYWDVSAVLGKLGRPSSLHPSKEHRITSSETVGKKAGFEQSWSTTTPR